MYRQIFEEIKQNVIGLLEKNLDARLTYHNLQHTLDVLEQAENIANREGVTDPGSLFYLKVAALTHDSGFIRVYFDHEVHSCEIMRSELLPYDLPEEKLKIITNLIMATKVPQSPQTPLEEILCDADLDYLGRDDYYKISDCLRREFLAYGILHNVAEWKKLQIRFLKSHHYFTKSSQILRDPQKLETLHTLKTRLK
jgi:uncharacterized protein